MKKRIEIRNEESLISVVGPISDDSQHQGSVQDRKIDVGVRLITRSIELKSAEVNQNRTI